MYGNLRSPPLEYNSHRDVWIQFERFIGGTHKQGLARLPTHTRFGYTKKSFLSRQNLWKVSFGSFSSPFYQKKSNWLVTLSVVLKLISSPTMAPWWALVPSTARSQTMVIDSLTRGSINTFQGEPLEREHQHHLSSRVVVTSSTARGASGPSLISRLALSRTPCSGGISWSRADLEI